MAGFSVFYVKLTLLAKIAAGMPNCRCWPGETSQIPVFGPVSGLPKITGRNQRRLHLREMAATYALRYYSETHVHPWGRCSL